MDNTNYDKGRVYDVKDMIRAVCNGYGYDMGIGDGSGSGIYLTERWGRTINSITEYRTDRVILFLYGKLRIHVMNVRGNPEPISSLANHNGGGKGKDGYGYGCGICHNNNGVVTDNKGMSWCDKIIPVEVSIDKLHN
jgi:hypothetical protein